MEDFAKDFVAILQYLLPGFVSAWIFYGLTSYSKPSQFERVVQAMVFTLFIQISVNAIKFALIFVGNYWSFAKWDDSSRLVWSVIVASFLGVIFSYVANNDTLHGFLRRNTKITKQSSFPSEWFGVFLEPKFVVLHLNDGRRLYGWPDEWPSEPTKGHFVITAPSWLVANENGQQEEKRINGVKNILINVNDVKWVEFLENIQENNNEERL